MSEALPSDAARLSEVRDVQSTNRTNQTRKHLLGAAGQTTNTGVFVLRSHDVLGMHRVKRHGWSCKVFGGFNAFKDLILQSGHSDRC